MGDIVILAPTAGGKTEAAFFPVISLVLSEGLQGLSVLYVSPIRALLNNQEERLRRYFELVGRRAACWHGDTGQGDRRRIVSDPPDCLLTTPESLKQSSYRRRRIIAGSSECAVPRHRRTPCVRRRRPRVAPALGISRIQRLASCDLQRIGLSATVGNPAEMLGWLSRWFKPKAEQVVAPPPAERQAPNVQLDYVGSLENAAKVISLLHNGEKRLVFCDSRSRVSNLPCF